MKIAIIKSSYHTHIMQGLYTGAIEYLKSQQFSDDDIQMFEAPGAFEIPLLAKALAESGKFAGVVCLGCVIKGDTAHFEYISEAVSHGLMKVTLESDIPVTFGILTTYTEEQAHARSLANGDNKGIEAARACVEAIRTLAKIHKNI